MSLIYSVPFNGTVTAAGTDTDLWSITPADDHPVRLWGFTLGQVSEVGDAAEEGLRITVKMLPATFTVGSGGSAVTALPPPQASTDTVWQATVRTNDTTVATSSGTVQICDEFGWNERASPCDHFYNDYRFLPGAKQTQGLVVRCETTAADDLTFSGTLWFEEM